MQPDRRISEALTRLGERDPLAWARKYATWPLVDLNRMLDAGVAPVELEHFVANWARDCGRYDEFARTEAVRRLNEDFPRGFGESDAQEYGLASGWALWSSLFEPSHQPFASRVWQLLTETMRGNPEWCPTDPDDRLLLAAFEGTSFSPTDGSKRLAEVLGRIEREVSRDNQPYTESRAVANLGRVPAGYGYVYSLYAVDGEVCNGGFDQFYGNTGGAPICLAITGFLALGRDDFAEIVAESLMHAATLPQFRDRLPFCENPLQMKPSPRPFEILDEAYYALRNAENSHWIDAEVINLILDRPDIF